MKGPIREGPAIISYPGPKVRVGGGNVIPWMGQPAGPPAVDRPPGPKPGRPLGRHPQRILEMLKQRPGLNIDEIAAQLGLRRTAANHHLRILERSAAIVKVKQAGHQLHFTTDTPRLEREILCVLRVASVRDGAQLLLQGHPPSSSSLAAALNVTGRTTRRALRLLTSRGLLRTEVVDGHAVAHLHPVLRVLMMRNAQAAAAADHASGGGVPNGVPNGVAKGTANGLANGMANGVAHDKRDDQAP